KRLQLALPGGRLAAAVEHAEGIAHAVVVAGRAGTALREIRRRARLAVGAHLPGRAMAGQRLRLEAGDVRVGEAGEIIETLVVFAHVVEAEAEILALAHPPHRRAVGAGA